MEYSEVRKNGTVKRVPKVPRFNWAHIFPERQEDGTFDGRTTTVGGAKGTGKTSVLEHIIDVTRPCHAEANNGFYIHAWFVVTCTRRSFRRYRKILPKFCVIYIRPNDIKEDLRPAIQALVERQERLTATIDTKNRREIPYYGVALDDCMTSKNFMNNSTFRELYVAGRNQSYWFVNLTQEVCVGTEPLIRANMDVITHGPPDVEKTLKRIHDMYDPYNMTLSEFSTVFNKITYIDRETKARRLFVICQHHPSGKKILCYKPPNPADVEAQIAPDLVPTSDDPMCLSQRRFEHCACLYEYWLIDRLATKEEDIGNSEDEAAVQQEAGAKRARPAPINLSIDGVTELNGGAAADDDDICEIGEQ